MRLTITLLFGKHKDINRARIKLSQTLVFFLFSVKLFAGQTSRSVKLVANIIYSYFHFQLHWMIAWFHSVVPVTTDLFPQQTYVVLLSYKQQQKVLSCVTKSVTFCDHFLCGHKKCDHDFRVCCLQQSKKLWVELICLKLSSSLIFGHENETIKLQLKTL